MTAIKGKDILAVAQTGTGKTAAFALPILQLLAEKIEGDAFGWGQEAIRDNPQKTPARASGRIR